MTLRPSSRRSAVANVAVAALLGAAFLLAAVPESASAASMPNPTCPQGLATVGFPISSDDVMKPVPPPITLAVTVEGDLPEGLHLFNDSGRAYFYGTPAKVQTLTFTVKATVTDEGDSTTSGAICTVAVQPAPVVSRIAGKDRFEQSALVSKATFAKSGLVFLASGEKFPDALSAASVAGWRNAPLLLTPSARVTDEVVNELKRLAPSNVIVVGGPLAVSPAVLEQVSAAVGTSTFVTRIDGADRFEVSRNLTTSRFGITNPEKVFIATGTNFPDALGASPAAALVDSPVLLVNGGATSLTTAETTALFRLGPTTTPIIGGTLAVSAALETDLAKRYTTDRFGGGDRFEVNAGLNKSAFKPGVDTLYLASGSNFPDALSGGAAAGSRGNPLAITEQNCLSEATASTIGRLVPSKVVILGGTASLGAPLDSLTICPAE
jgi:putative cell wall-binding protein